ncbi:MAG: response regulator, partial [Hyphomicrobiales bacterium]|nr:response regulator [Hyphomicrobiales bacterium]
MASAQRKPRSKSTSRSGSGRNVKAAKKPKPTPIRVLVVDDNQNDLSRIERCLGQMVSYKAAVEHAASLAETQSAIEAKKFDVALVDFHLGNETGTRVMRELGGRT